MATKTFQGKRILYKNLGKINYIDGLLAMKEIANLQFKAMKMNYQPPNTLLLCEHFPVYTTGIRDKKSEEDVKHLRKLGAEFHYTNRGGLITFHGPGQLMCYPVLNLKCFTMSVRCYNQMLEEVAIRTCNRFGVTARRTVDPGVWIDNSKIAAIGMLEAIGKFWNF